MSLISVLFNHSTECFMQEVNPALALELLKTSPGNRKLRKGRIHKYASDMKRGYWGAGVDAICLDKKKSLRNGHHRLWAVVLSQTTQRFLFRINVPEEELISIDGQEVRTPVDAVAFNPKLGPVDRNEVAVMNMVLTEGGRYREVSLTNELVISEIIKRRQELNFVLKECFGARHISGVTTAPLMAVFVRASYMDVPDIKTKLQYAASFLVNGYVNPPVLQGTKSLQALQKVLSRNKVNMGGTGRLKIYNRVAEMLSAFLRGEERERSSEAKAELFAIPDPPPAQHFQDVAPELMIAIRDVMKKLKDGDSLTPKQVAEKLIEAKMPVTPSLKNPVKAVSGRVAKLVKNQPFKIPGVGSFRAVGSGDRTSHYVFTADDTADQLLNRLRQGA